jgi:plastocyanin
MQRKSSGAWLACAAALCAACGGGKPEEKAAEKTAVAAKPVEYFHVDTATAGTLRGKVTFTGVKPAKKLIAMDADANCQKANEGRKVYDDPVVTGNDGSLSNAFVYIKAGLEGKNFESTKEPINIVQHGCMFDPRVIAVRAGQPVNVKNPDPVSHNFHAMPTNNRDWDQQQSPGAPDMEHRFPRPEIMIPVKCNVHSWMRAYIGVMPHPYFAITGADGAFELKDVPPGDYTVAAWHEKLGEVESPVHLNSSGKEGVNFTFKEAGKE